MFFIFAWLFIDLSGKTWCYRKSILNDIFFSHWFQFLTFGPKKIVKIYTRFWVFEWNFIILQGVCGQNWRESHLAIKPARLLMMVFRNLEVKIRYIRQILVFRVFTLFKNGRFWGFGANITRLLWAKLVYKSKRVMLFQWFSFLLLNPI